MYPPLPAWPDLSESVFPEFTEYWSLIQTSSWVRLPCLGFTWAQTSCLTETYHTRLSSLGIKCVGLSNPKFCGPKMSSLVKVNYQSHASCFWKNHHFLWCPPSTYGFDFSISSLPQTLMPHQARIYYHNFNRSHWSLGHLSGSQVMTRQWRTAIRRGSQIVSMSIKFFFLCF